MANIGDPITPSVPAPGAAGPQYATDIDSILNEVVARLTKKVPLSSLDLSANLSLSGASVLNARGYTFTDLEATPAGSPSRRLATFGGDLFYVSPSGAVQVTSGAALNSASIGGITGDYGGANPAQFRFDALNARYDAFANFGTGTWADVRARGLSLAAGATSSVHARLLFAGAANKTYTLPAAASSTQDRPLYIDTAGQIKVGHGNQRLKVTLFGALLSGATSILSNGTVQSAGGSGLWSKGFDGIPTGAKIVQVLVRLRKTDTTSNTFSIWKSLDGGVIPAVASTTTTASGLQTVTITPASPEVVANDAQYGVQNNATMKVGDEVYGVELILAMDP